jgi:hypothetical protein
MPSWDIQGISAWSGLVGISVVGLVTFAFKKLRARQQMIELEKYLRMRKAKFPDQYQHSLEHLTLHTSLSRDQIEQAARLSRRISRIPRQDSKGMALPYLLEWKGKP